MGSTYGQSIKISIYGESHGKSIGVVIDGLPAGEAIDLAKVREQSRRRRPGDVTIGATSRKEPDLFEVMSGMLDGKTTGAPLHLQILNKDQKSQDYQNIMTLPRPSHADYTGYVRYHGFNDVRGGGHFSGRLTAPLVLAGAFARQILERHNIHIGAHLLQVGNTFDDAFDKANVSVELLNKLSTEEFAVINPAQGDTMKETIRNARVSNDSIGGTVECAVTGLNPGIGSPMFDSIESRIAAMMFGIPAVKGIEFGAGFAFADMLGSFANDSMYYDKDGKVKTTTNNNGGILGGITNGMPLIMRTVIKPTSSIGTQQSTINLETKENDKLIINGRHDACIAVRAVPVIESGVAVALLDILKSEGEL